jgi:RNA-splicing ligase RtcB
MPDVHAGMGCTIGTTMTIHDKIVPGMVGVDIGCGMEAVKIANSDINFANLDKLIRMGIPAGREVREDYHALNDEIDLSELRCAAKVHLDRARHSIGTLGGGNHFIEVDRAKDGSLFVVVHSGSRHLGKEVAEYYQDEAYKQLSGTTKAQLAELIAQLKAQGREREIEQALRRAKGEVGNKTINKTASRPTDKTADKSTDRATSKTVGKTTVPKDLAYVSGSLFDDYLHDMKIVQRFAVLNREAMADVIMRGMGLEEVERFTTIHNYIDTDAMILRKGAVSARQGERLLIPLNMRDGSLICIGRGNADWNYSAPHGAGRLMSRKTAFGNLSMDECRADMAHVFTTCVNEGTLDESPMAYKGMDVIVGNIAPTAEIECRIQPVYNFKAGE